MRRALFSVAIVATLSLSVYTYTQRQQSTDMNQLSLANVEALANGDINPNCPNGCSTATGICYCNGTHPYAEVRWPN